MGITLSLVICTYQRPDSLSALLRSVMLQSRMPDQILVIDASIDNDTEGMIMSDQCSMHLEYHHVAERHRGLTKQRNYGIEVSTGQIIAFLDDDIILEPDYFEALLRCYERHPDAIAVGGYIVNENEWLPIETSAGTSNGWYEYDAWRSRESLRYRLRSWIGLGCSLPAGWIPEYGHGRATGLYPPTGKAYRVETLMGCVMSFRKGVFSKIRFSNFFEGYGLYEDMDFTLRASKLGPLYIATDARCNHHHAQEGRPIRFRFGQMVVRNGWYVWRVRWPRPRLGARIRWWGITALLIMIRLSNAVTGPYRMRALSDAVGRLIGMWTVFINPPRIQE